MNVYLYNIANYSDPRLRDAIFEGLKASLPPDFSGKRVLIKPNVLSASHPDDAVTTHPEVVGAVIAFFKSRDCEVRVGDSPAVDSPARAYQKTGLAEVCMREGATLVAFKKMRSFTGADALVVKRFQLTTHLDWAEFIVSVPKLKNHVQMYYTGALKNMFGLITGLEKSKYHLRFTDRKNFASMIVDLNTIVKPGCAVIDAVQAMEGDGPRSGSPVYTGFVGVSTDPLALDCACARYIGYDPLKIPILNDSLKRPSFYINGLDDVSVKGDFSNESRFLDFKRVEYVRDIAFLRNRLPASIYSFVRNLFIPHPVFKHKKCRLCLKCAQICSAEALMVSEGKIVIDRNLCILCFCCHEVCPYGAISLKK
ncbi:MAG: DUF362 domain-containing protein [Spirochaetes bacterium]|jgi:uncharacterized protein (DUF362 family)/Pyruvate/2-oxoacid:ferredoxin oxidoreductase delta subunit|nr:DUF362 domain-containing protein [Spirochaetota bacterium]